MIPITICKSNPIADSGVTEVEGFVDLRDSYVNGVVPSDITANADAYNDIDDPDSMLPKSDDVFGLYRTNDYIQSKSKELRDAAKSSTATATSGEN